MDSETKSDHLDYKPSLNLPSARRIASTMEILINLLKNDGNQQPLSLAVNSPKNDLLHYSNANACNASPLLGLMNRLCESTKMAVLWLAEEAERRENLIEVNMYRRRSHSTNERLNDSYEESFDSTQEENGKSCASRSSLYHHKAIIHNTSRKRFDCAICGNTYASLNSLCSHKRNMHTSRKRLECQTCGNTFKSNRNLNIHRQLHAANEEGRRPFKCDVCSKRFSQRGGLKTHELLHSVLIFFPWRCDKCGKGCSNKINLEIHMKCHQDDEKARKPHQCTVCGYRLTTAGSLRRHMITHLPDEEKPRLLCEICGKTFSCNSTLNNHKQDHFDDDKSEVEKLSFKCDQCGNAFRKGFYLERHKLIHSNQERSFKCDLCGVASKTKQALKLHMYIHNGNHPYKCDICNTGCKTNVALKLHKEKYCKPKQCNLCPRRFKTDDEVGKHLLRHKYGTVAVNKRILECKECGRKFKTKEGRRLHQLSHLEGLENQRPMQCELCNKRYTRSSALRSHIKLKHPEHVLPMANSNIKVANVNTVTCDFCKKSMSNQGIKKHMAMIHPEQRWESTDRSHGGIYSDVVKRGGTSRMKSDSEESEDSECYEDGDDEEDEELEDEDGEYSRSNDEEE